MANRIHPSAVIDPAAVLGDGIEIGPLCTVAAGVELGDGCRLLSHVSIEGPSRIGQENIFHPFCSIGGRSQDLKYAGEPTYLEVGDRNRFREYVTLNRGTAPGSRTTLGSDNNLLAYAHVAHDCTVGSHCIFSNNGTLAGHVTMEDYAIIGGLSAVHQFCRLGRMSIIGGCSKIVQDVPPYMVADGNPAAIRSVNLVAIQRNGISEEEQKALKAAFKLLFNDKLNTTQALEKIEQEITGSPCVEQILSFVRASQRGIIR